MASGLSHATSSPSNGCGTAKSTACATSGRSSSASSTSGAEMLFAFAIRSRDFKLLDPSSERQQAIAREKAFIASAKPSVDAMRPRRALALCRPEIRNPGLHIGESWSVISAAWFLVVANESNFVSEFCQCAAGDGKELALFGCGHRSEERRVGKEG